MSSGGRDGAHPVVEGVLDEGEGLAGDVALEDAEGVLAAVASGPSPSGGLAGAGVADHAVVRDGTEGVVGVAVAAAAESVAVALSAAGLDGAGPAEGGEGGVAVQPVGVGAGGDEPLGGAVGSDAGPR